MSARVAVVGAGIVSPIGTGWDGFRSNLLEGRSGAAPVTTFDASGLPSRVAAEVKGFDLADHVDAEEAARIRERFDRKIELGVAAGVAAIRDAGFEPGQVDLGRIAVSLGTSLSYPTLDHLREELAPLVGDDGTFDYTSYAARLRDGRSARTSRHLFDEVTRWLGRRVQAQGALLTHFSACSASTQAIGCAFRRIRRGEADLCFAGGYDSMVNPFGMVGFIRLGALTRHNDPPERASRPFDLTRNGFLLGEGAVVVVLEELGSAIRNGRTIFGEIIGYGSSLDASTVTAPHPEGAGAVFSMQRAIADAGLSSDEIDYVNAHGTGTPLNDVMETRAIHDVFGNRAQKIPVSSSKSMFGHLVAAAGAVELVACLVALREGKVPPTINLNKPDPSCDLDYVPNEAREADVRIALSNSFAFGGQNATLVVQRFEP